MGSSIPICLFADFLGMDDDVIWKDAALARWQHYYNMLNIPAAAAATMLHPLFHDDDDKPDALTIVQEVGEGCF